jgi:hypothetical protein
MKKIFIYSLLTFGLFTFGCQQASENNDDQVEDLHKKAVVLAQTTIMVDGHVDIPYRLRNHPEDISVETANGHFDYVRGKAGGLNAQ